MVLLDLSHAAPDIISMVLGSMSLRDRCNCALVCKAWAGAAAAATHSVILWHVIEDVSGLQQWLEKHGNRLEVLQLHSCCNETLTALPCFAKLQDLLLHDVTIASRTWRDIASGSKITSISLEFANTPCQQADVVAALTALPNLEQLTWHHVYCNEKEELSNGLLLQCSTRLTSLDLEFVTAASLQHLGSLTKLQHLSIIDADDWALAGCPGLQELNALTTLKIESDDLLDLPASASWLTALQQLEVSIAAPTALNTLHVLTDLTQLCVWEVTGMSPASPPLKLPGLRHLKLFEDANYTMPMSFLASCTRLHSLELDGYKFQGPGSLVASTMLQHLRLSNCKITAADGAAEPVSWQLVFPGPDRLPHLTSLRLFSEKPPLQEADMEGVVACCSNLQALGCDRLSSSYVPVLARLPGLTNLLLLKADDDDCSAVVQLTGLSQLKVTTPWQLSAVGLRRLGALQQLTSLGLGNNFSCIKLIILAKHLMNDSLPGCWHALVNKAPSGSPSDVSRRLLDMCDVMDACEGVNIQTVMAAAMWEMKSSGSPGPSTGEGSDSLTAEVLLAAATALKAQQGG